MPKHACKMCMKRFTDARALAMHNESETHRAKLMEKSLRALVKHDKAADAREGVAPCIELQKAEAVLGEASHGQK